MSMDQIYLSSFAMLEPEDDFYLYSPSWLNVWESYHHNKSLKATQAQAWNLKRFGTVKDTYAGEMIRTPDYMKYIEAMEQAADLALQKMTAKERMLLMRSRTAFIYIDSWGESGLFEDISSMMHVTLIDTLPKNLLKIFSVKNFTCKIRGEKQSLMQAIRLAQDYLNWDVFDFVVICGAYRAIPILIFSEEEGAATRKEKPQRIRSNMCVERVGCFIFSQRESPLEIGCGSWVMPHRNETGNAEPLIGEAELSLVSMAGLSNSKLSVTLASALQAAGAETINLSDRYGSSGCLTPALSWIYLEQHVNSSAKMRTIVPDHLGGYNYFDSWYC
ncbi:ATP-binding protein [Mixta calida]|uniref:ATP-binding protein n=1 Tax=Mixta calida TaxID=665913 RepID=UPI00290ABF9D|nr:ATP-binding protein [Mixta calida]MDU4288017.1 ATP-binding protein [Mixta calida]